MLIYDYFIYVIIFSEWKASGKCDIKNFAIVYASIIMLKNLFREGSEMEDIGTRVQMTFLDRIVTKKTYQMV